MTFLGMTGQTWLCLFFGHDVEADLQRPDRLFPRRTLATCETHCNRCGKTFGQHERIR